MSKCLNYVGRNKQLSKISFISFESTFKVGIDANDKELTRHDSGECKLLACTEYDLKVLVFR